MDKNSIRNRGYVVIGQIKTDQDAYRNEEEEEKEGVEDQRNKERGKR